jgi:divalent metal cation (Fe/Co/Zn/Cd) transporter
VAVSAFNKQRGGQRAWAALRGSKDPALFTVLLEDLAALAGLLIALAGTIAADLLGWIAADAVASIAIGVVLALVATFMSVETKSLVIGEAASTEMVEGVRKLIEAEAAQSCAIRRVHAIRTMHLGPNDVLAAVRLDFDDAHTPGAFVSTVVSGDVTAYDNAKAMCRASRSCSTPTRKPLF